MIGFFGSYWLGLPPSRTPPCGVARNVGVGEATVEADFAIVAATTDAMEDILSVLLWCHCHAGCRDKL
jgi:hypothetical protein